ncbi:hypothetical protein FRC01_006051, partial [Tulasnella sp. 417]
MLQLPTELFAEIFHSTLPSTDLMLDQVDTRLRSYMRKLYGMRLVAKRWQEIIDGTPTFWTFVHSDLPPDVNEATALRSQNGLLAIVYALTEYRTPHISAKDFFNSWAHIFPRWSAYRGPLLSEYLDKPAPQIEKIILTRGESGDEPLELLGGSATSLRLVNLSHVSIRWKAGLFTNLNVLKLVDVNHNPQELTTTLFLDILLASPCLEHLELARMGATADTASSYPIITLPHLRIIRFYYCSYTLMGGILRQIRASSCTEFWLNIDVDEPVIGQLINEDLRPFHALFRAIHKHNGSSEIILDGDGFQWKSSAEEGPKDHPSFSVFTFCDLPITCIRWVERTLQSDPGLSIRFSFNADVSQDVLESMASMRCVTRVTIGDISGKDEFLSVLRFIGSPL